MAEPGAVAWQFERKGVDPRARRSWTRTTSCWSRSTPAPRTSQPAGEIWSVTCEATLTVGGAPRPRGGRASPVESSDLTMLPTSTVELDSAEAAKGVLRLIDALDDHDDVQDVYANVDIPDDVPGRHRGLRLRCRALAVGDVAPDFDAARRRRRAPGCPADWPAGRVPGPARWCWSFYPGDDSPVCTAPARGVHRAGSAPSTTLDAEVLAIVAPVAGVAPGFAEAQRRLRRSRC